MRKRTIESIVLVTATLACGALCGALLGFPWAARFAWLAPLTLFPVFHAFRSGVTSRCVWMTVLFTAAQLLVGFHWIYAGAATYQGAGAYYTTAIALLFECIPYALLGLVVSRLARFHAVQWCVTIAGLWTLCEFWRGTSPLGVPYVQLAHGLIDTPLVGLARIGGTEVLTFIGVAAAAGAFELSRRARTTRIVVLGLCAVAVATSAVAPKPQSPIPEHGIDVAILQYGHVDGDTFYEYLDQYHALNATGGFAVLPESTLDLGAGSELDAIRSAVRAKHLPLLAGGMVTDDSGLHDALVYFGPNGTIKGSYAKRQLIPFSEALPFPWLAHIIIPTPLVNDVMRFAPGDRPATFAIGNRVIGPLICYESAFPALARDDVREGANLLVAASDDGWFSDTSGFFELEQTARLVAIETGTPMVVAGTVGPSGTIDSDGRWATQLPIGLPTDAVLVAPSGYTTIYDTIGDWPPLAAIIALVVFAFASSRVRKNASSSS